MFGLWPTKSGQTYSYKMVMSFASDPSNIVHDIHGEFDLEHGETIKDAQEKLIAEYRGMAGKSRRDDVQVLSWSCK
jgi:hypothetical protein